MATDAFAIRLYWIRKTSDVTLAHWFIVGPMGDLYRLIWCAVARLFCSLPALQAEILVLSHELAADLPEVRDDEDEIHDPLDSSRANPMTPCATGAGSISSRSSSNVSESYVRDGNGRNDAMARQSGWATAGVTYRTPPRIDWGGLKVSTRSSSLPSVPATRHVGMADRFASEASPFDGTENASAAWWCWL